ncbi:YtxH domain-containing protein [Alkalithermobacter paradoxus]|uniref:YtxH-like protein n=1 Tax=Alkalithermobacter paradoxus TaxID=29349 RepID=A0A1V4I684_9FIRM|nr:YtxH-like protein [[Clostridium] thermoalcaliphilum]
MSRRCRYFLFGGIVGSLIALLLTPKTGKETREVIMEKTRDIVNNPEDFKMNLKYKLKNIIRSIYFENEIVSSENEIIISKEFKEEEVE